MEETSENLDVGPDPDRTTSNEKEEEEEEEEEGCCRQSWVLCFFANCVFGTIVISAFYGVLGIIISKAEKETPSSAGSNF